MYCLCLQSFALYKAWFYKELRSISSSFALFQITWFVLFPIHNYVIDKFEYRLRRLIRRYGNDCLRRHGSDDFRLGVSVSVSESVSE